MRHQTYDAKQLDVERSFAAIARWESKVQAFIEPDEALARQRAEQVCDGTLTGWSLAVKDIIDIAGEPTRCNADFVPPRQPTKNAALVDQLVQRGAFIIAKSVTTTFAYADPGPTRNPWNLHHTPGGSSSGSAAAVACRMARIALGTQTVGSINRPASFCGVVGFKPTYGRLPMEGIFPFAPSVDTVGFFTANVTDSQTAFAAVTGAPQAQVPDQLRIGLMTDLGCSPAEPPMLDALHSAATTFSQAGHQVTAVELPPAAAEAHGHHLSLIAKECADAHRELFSRYGRAYTPNLRRMIERGMGVSSAQLQRCEDHRRQTRDKLECLFDAYDLLITPAAAGAAPKGLDSTGDPRMNLLWTYTGLPVITLPVALADGGLPLGVQLIGRLMEDQALLGAARVLESIVGFDDEPEMG